MFSRSKALLILWVIVGFINLYIFVKREHYQYVPYASYQNLYQDGNKILTNPAAIYTKDELDRAYKLTSEVVNDSMTTMEKLKVLSNFLLTRFHNQRGIPTPSLLQARAMQTFDSLQANKSNKVWCGHFGNMFLLFATVHGIEGRYIEVYNPGDHHVFNEFYIPELNRWVMTDIYNDILFAESVNGHLLNAQTFRKEVNSSNPIRILAFTDSSYKRTLLQKNQEAVLAYHTKANPYYYYLTTNLPEVYSTLNKVKRYISSDSWFYIYDDVQPGNNKHYLKLGFLAGWLLLGIMVSISLINPKQ